jgi:hypothetical protein
MTTLTPATFESHVFRALRADPAAGADTAAQTQALQSARIERGRSNLYPGVEKLCSVPSLLPNELLRPRFFTPYWETRLTDCSG